MRRLVEVLVHEIHDMQWRKSRWGGEAAAAPPPTFVENDEFSDILIYKRVKNSLFECKWGGGCRKFESFVGNLEGFASHRKK